MCLRAKELNWKRGTDGMLVADRMITGDGKTVIEEGAVVLENGRIKAAGPVQELQAQFPGEEKICP